MATMHTTRAEAGKAPAAAPAEKGAPAEKAAPAAETAAAEPKAKKLKAFLPLIISLVAAPALAFAVTQFVLVPKLAARANAPKEAAADSHAKTAAEEKSSHGSKKEEHAPAKDAEKAELGAGTGKAGKYVAPLSKKILVNVAGTMGTRYLLAECTLVGSSASVKDAVEKADPELRDAAASTLASKTITDLEKPGIRNLVRAELINVFNSILGKGTISEIYLTEFAIQ